jgi:DNA-binding HxlR family transcriptional regulator
VDYALTPLGHTLEEPLNALAAWAQQHMAAIGEAQAAYDARSGGHLRLQRPR